MIDLELEPEKKLLGADAWIELPEDIRIRFDYLTESQDVELRRLQMLWFGKMAGAQTDHWLSYYLRATIREVKGLTVGGKPTELVVERGLARTLTGEGGTLDLIAAFIQLDVLEAIASMIRKRLDMTEVEKKTLVLSQTSSKGENSSQTTNDSPPA